MSYLRNRKRRYPGFMKNMKKRGKKITSSHRCDLAKMEILIDAPNPWGLAKWYPKLFQYRFAKYIRRHSNKNT